MRHYEVCQECPADGLPCSLYRDEFDPHDLDGEPCSSPEDCFCIEGCSVDKPSETCYKMKGAESEKQLFNKKGSLNPSEMPSHNEPLIVVRREVLAKAYADPVFGKRLENAQTFREIASILEAFCQRNNYKTKTVAIP